MPSSAISEEYESQLTNWSRFSSFQPDGPYSTGKTTALRVQSELAVKRPGVTASNILDLDPDKAAELLNTHLQWWSSYPPGIPGSNLVSWTSDLLFAIILGLEYSKSVPEEKIHILMLDTKGIKRHFVDALKLARHFYSGLNRKDLESTYATSLKDLIGWRQGPWISSEFLSQGTLDVRGRCVRTDLQKIREARLYEMYRELDDPNYSYLKLMKRLLETRSMERMADSSQNDVHRAINIGRCFGYGGRRALYVALLVFALAERQEFDDGAALEEILGHFSELVDEIDDIDEFDPDLLNITQCLSLPAELKRAEMLVLQPAPEVDTDCKAVRQRVA
ncbi:hypothetical protein QBC38DRAFT_515647 [Podospora fimiseda]|uniref:Uncharacterized protein n=1 Tax=Podospora fimiseda TaxID=252190 RepID=A0AAN7GPQ9_9PEZI|nr:hypothetical protein QBC38DRAFT_515647 [Podospora fimiseda]